MSAPPNTPPGDGAPPPFPPYDPKTQWKDYRAQRKAAWRAQRDAWKAQVNALKYTYKGPYVPRVPSIVGPILLIGVGVVALLVAIGRIAPDTFWSWYGHWWPLLLIAAGAILLAEWALDLRRQVPVRRGGGFVGLIVLLAILGCCASGRNHSRPWFGHWNGDDWQPNEDFWNVFGLPEHDRDQPSLFSRIPANSVVEIDNPRGDVSVTADNVSTIEVQAHEEAYANSDGDAKKIFDAEAPRINVSGNAALIKSESNAGGRVNLTVTVPKSARVTVNSGKGDVTAADLGASLVVNARGDVHLSSIAGSVQSHFSEGKHDFSAHQIEGDLTADGDCDDLTLSEIKGKVTQNGEILGDVHIESVAGAIHLHTSRTDLELAALPGDLSLDSDDLRVTEAKGPVHVVTNSKDVDLSQIYGDSYVEDHDGRISVEPAGAYGVEAKNGKGDVEVTLPPNASATVNGRTRNGDIETDFDLAVSGAESKTVSGRIGAGASKIVLSAENGDVRIKKGSGFPDAAQTAPTAGSAPANALHLKAPKTLPATPAVQ